MMRFKASMHCLEDSGEQKSACWDLVVKLRRLIRTTSMSRCRPFKLIDFMIVVAVVVAWTAAMRPRWNQFQAVWAGIGKRPPWQAYPGIARP